MHPDRERSASRSSSLPCTTITNTKPLWPLPYSAPRECSVPLEARSSLAFQHECLEPVHEDVTRSLPSNTSMTNSIPRIRSDVTEFDAQGYLRKRTITTSYTSLPNITLPPVEQYNSSLKPQSHMPGTEAGHRHRVSSGSTFRRVPKARSLFCPHCSDSKRFSIRAILSRHMCKRHADYVAPPVDAQKYQRLKIAYKRRTNQLRWALQTLDEIMRKPINSDKEASGVMNAIKQNLKDMDLSRPSSSDDSEDIEVVHASASVGEEYRRYRTSEDNEGEAVARFLVD